MFLDTQVRPQGEVVDAVAPAKMKLSAAIRIGAKLRPQCTGTFFDGFGSCALGAIMEGSGLVKAERKLSLLPTRVWTAFPELFWGPGDFTELAKKIYERNDSGHSRESIADWLESQGL
jgi:hypothetical protein